ncbi:Protein CBG23752 [Caenorhabditis briggsae]|uniref:Protein CBG23752 n=1 Tax=Caenorhabditis briggsae TaxID=6238 RepID=A8WJ76_CAEBR|nr:Protein CBG23752 [Caenorhabditis briggsae]CAP20518.1 Protein CBG23752 [Caenorhabditis briggsae]
MVSLVEHSLSSVYDFGNVVVISLTMILYRLQTISNQNDRVNSMQSQFGNVERKIGSLVSRKPYQDINQFEGTKPLKQSIADVLKSMKIPTQKLTDYMEPTIIPQINQSISKTAESTLKVPIPKEQFRFNAADYQRGASVDMDHSSSSNLNPIIGHDQTNLVLLDRPQPPSDNAWCTNDENPVLTVNLAKYIKPISVSYQHSKWNETIPNGAPKTYDVVACLDFYCEKWKPLVSNCIYSQYVSSEPEQMCNISSHLDVPSIGKVQFRFRENYGDAQMTCVHLVRVYGETETPVKIKEKKVESEEICADLRWYYHNSYFRYTWTDKNCTAHL